LTRYLTNTICLFYNRSMMKIDKEKDKKVIEMREKYNCTWAAIGAVYGISRQGAQDYYNRAKRRQNAKRSPLIRLMDKLYKKITK
jgi:hypothetical protein